MTQKSRKFEVRLREYHLIVPLNMFAKVAKPMFNIKDYFGIIPAITPKFCVVVFTRVGTWHAAMQ
jgi:hypothetical protein